jgi:hypothetical protein
VFDDLVVDGELVMESSATPGTVTFFQDARIHGPGTFRFAAAPDNVTLDPYEMTLNGTQTTVGPKMQLRVDHDLDIAGVGWGMKDKPHRPDGGTGYGVLLLLELVRREFLG